MAPVDEHNSFGAPESGVAERQLRRPPFLGNGGIHALDGEIGHVEDLFVEDADWSIHYLLVDTKNWWPGKKVLISPRSAQTIDWRHKLVNLNVGRQKVKDSQIYDASTTIDRPYERQFHSYYDGVRPSHPL